AAGPDNGRPALAPLKSYPKIAPMVELCWSPDPDQRPSFAQIVRHFDDIKAAGYISRMRPLSFGTLGGGSRKKEPASPVTKSATDSSETSLTNHTSTRPASSGTASAGGAVPPKRRSFIQKL